MAKSMAKSASSKKSSASAKSSKKSSSAKSASSGKSSKKSSGYKCFRERRATELILLGCECLGSFHSELLGVELYKFQDTPELTRALQQIDLKGMNYQN